MNNRELKFRVWDTEFKRMLFYGPNYTLGFGFTLMETDKNFTNQTNAIVHNLSPVSEEGWYKYNKDRFIIQQFTGLKDKHKKEICEGDILKIADTKSSHPQMVGYVEYFPESLCYTLRHPGSKYYRYDLYVLDEPVLPEKKGTITNAKTCKISTHFIEIIGNIHETPDLLK